MSAIVKEGTMPFTLREWQKPAAAAKALADYDERFVQINDRFNKVESDLLILKWMVGLVIVVNVVPMENVVFVLIECHATNRLG